MTTKEKEAISYARERLSIDDYPVYNDEYELMLAFEAGAEWMAGQGETLYDTINVDGKNQRWLGENLLQGDYNAGQAVIVQIRKV